MPEVPPPPTPTQLIVFADDWGRHPSSSQHLTRELKSNYPTLWVNTTGTRKPRLTIADAGRAIDAVRGSLSSFRRSTKKMIADVMSPNLKVIRPLMYPGFRSPWQRRFNAKRIAKALQANLLPGHRHVVLTTLPITADLPIHIQADRWIYTCVDDYSEWPGTDAAVMATMEVELVDRCDAIVAVSESLRDRLVGMSDSPIELLTHGVDLDLWDGSRRTSWNATLNPNDPLDDAWWWYEPPAYVEQWTDQTVALFWGLIDARLEVPWLEVLHASATVDRLALVGPTNAPPEGLTRLTDMPGKATLSQLPAIAAAASVLIMPYIDAPVTRAMQPLKLLEYLATMKPVVVRDLPSTRHWADCCDLASDAESFVRLVEERAKTGIPPEQMQARKRRLATESWTAKATQLAELINAT